MFWKFVIRCTDVLRRLHILPKYPKKISAKTIQLLPIKSYDGDIHLVNTVTLAKKAVKEIVKCEILGFDTESKPAFIKGEKYKPSIIQIATDSAVYIFQLQKIQQLKHLKPILENENIKKVGIAIRDDVIKLKDIEIFEEAGFLDISDLTKPLGIKQTGLRNLAGIFLKCKISKSYQITDWAKENLSQKQLTYAATDTWISRLLYLEVISQIK